MAHIKLEFTEGFATLACDGTDHTTKDCTIIDGVEYDHTHFKTLDLDFDIYLRRCDYDSRIDIES